MRTIVRGESCAAWTVWSVAFILNGCGIVHGRTLSNVCDCLQLLPGMLKLWGLLLFLYKEAMTCHFRTTPSGVHSKTH